MTFRDVLRALLHRWYVSVGVLVIAIGLTGVLARQGNLYTTKTVVIFTLSGASSLLPDNGTLDQSVIDFASTVAQDINGDQPSPRYASVDAPLYGAGLRQGVAVRVPNNGGQWSPTSFSSAVIEIQIVGPDPAWVQAQQASVLARIMDLTREQQSTAPPSGRITAALEPLTREVTVVTASRTTRLMAIAAMGLAIAIFSSWLSATVDHHVRRRRSSRAVRGNRRVEPITSVPA